MHKEPITKKYSNLPSRPSILAPKEKLQKLRTNSIIKNTSDLNASNDGKGGSETMTMPTTNNTPSKYLIRFSSDPNASVSGGVGSVWLIDKETKSIVPFVNQQAFDNYYGVNKEDAFKSINTVDPSILLPGGEYGNFAILGPEYGIQPGGGQKKLDFFPKQIMNRYGKTASDEKTAIGTMQVDGWFSYLENHIDESGISRDTLDKIKNDPVTMAAYIGAVAYGGYQMDDIFMDIKKRELVDSGDTSVENLAPVNMNYLRADYLKTAGSGGWDSYQKLGSYVPANIGSLTRAEFSSAQLPDSFFKAVFPAEFNVDSPEFKQKMSEVTSLLHDSVLETLTADTTASKEAADFAWKNTRDQIEKKYGISLSDNALAAWNELETLQSNASEAGISGSGIANEKLVEALALRRTQGDRMRESKTQDELSTNNTYYTSKASPEEIAALSQEEADRLGIGYMKTGVNFNTWLSEWRAKFPNGAHMSDEEVKAKYFSPQYDDNGNLRSTLYQADTINKFKTTYGYDPKAIPAESLREYQAGIVEQRALDKITGEDQKKGTSYSVVDSANPEIPGYGTGPTGPSSTQAAPVTGIGDITGATGYTSSASTASSVSSTDASKKIQEMLAEANRLQQEVNKLPKGTTGLSGPTEPIIPAPYDFSKAMSIPKNNIQLGTVAPTQKLQLGKATSATAIPTAASSILSKYKIF
ncbi:MAG: hypothetical protein WCX88_01830 [Patescibacteria group bacterium]